MTGLNGWFLTLEEYRKEQPERTPMIVIGDKIYDKKEIFGVLNGIIKHDSEIQTNKEFEPVIKEWTSENNSTYMVNNEDRSYLIPALVICFHGEKSEGDFAMDKNLYEAVFGTISINYDTGRYKMNEMLAQARGAKHE